MGEGALESNYLYPNLGLTSANCVTTGKLLTFTLLNLFPRLSLREKQHASDRRLDEAVNWEGPRATPGRRCLLEHIAPVRRTATCSFSAPTLPTPLCGLEKKERTGSAASVPQAPAICSGGPHTQVSSSVLPNLMSIQMEISWSRISEGRGESRSPQTSSSNFPAQGHGSATPGPSLPVFHQPIKWHDVSWAAIRRMYTDLFLCVEAH